MSRSLRNFVVPAALAFVAMVGVAAQAGSIITSATKIAGNATAINLLDAGLAENVLAYSDRAHTLVNIHDDIEGGDLVQVSNSDKGSDPYQIDVTFGRLAALYVALDDRFAQPLPWMNNAAMTGLPTVFFNTGEKMQIDEGGDGTIENSFTLWTTIAPPGTYHLFQNLTTGNNYVIFGDNKLVPEPSSMLLVSMGLLGLVGAVRRK